MSRLTEPVVIAAIAAAGVIGAAIVSVIGLVIIQRLGSIHTAVNSRLTAALDLNQQLAAEGRAKDEVNYQLREQLALAKQLQQLTARMPAEQ